MKKIVLAFTILVSNILAAQNLVSVNPDTLFTDSTMIVSIVGQSSSFTAMQASSTSIYMTNQMYGGVVYASSYNVIDDLNLQATFSVPKTLNGYASTGNYNLWVEDWNMGMNLYLDAAFYVVGPSLVSSSVVNASAGQTITTTIVGQNIDFTQGSSTNIDLTGNTSISGYNINATSPTTVDVTFDIPANIGSQTMSLTYNDVSTGVLSLNGIFNVDGGEIISINPDTLTIGSPITVSVVGQGTDFTAFQGSSTAVYLTGNSNIYGYDITPVNATNFDVTFNIPTLNNGQNTTGNYSLVVNDNGGNLYSNTNVYVDGSKLIASSIDTANAGQTITVSIMGSNVDFTQGSSTNISLGGYSGYNIAIINATQIDVTFDLPFNMASGDFSINYYDPALGSLYLTNAIFVNGPTLESFTPDTLLPGQTITVNIVGQNVDFTQASSTTINLEGNISIGGFNINVISPTSLNVDFAVPSNAEFGSYNINYNDDYYGGIYSEGALYVGNANLVSINPAQVQAGSYGQSAQVVVNSMVNLNNASIYEVRFRSVATGYNQYANSFSVIDSVTLQVDFDMDGGYAGEFDVIVNTDIYGQLVLNSGFLVTPLAGFGWSGCPTDGITFTGVTFDSTLTHYWDIGGLETSTLAQPTTFAIAGEQSYTVSYTVTDTYGNSDVSSQNIYLSPCPGPAEIGWGGCFEQGNFFQNDNNDPNIVNKTWYYGDGSWTDTTNFALQDLNQVNYTYSATGNYTVMLVVEYSNAPADTGYFNVNVENCPLPSDFNMYGCFPDTISFTNYHNAAGMVNKRWYFGEGVDTLDINTATIPNSGSNITQLYDLDHVTYYYSNPGVYDVMLIIEYDDFTADTSIMSVQVDDTMCNGDGNGNDQISWDSECLQDSITFSLPGAELDGIDSLVWYFGDGNFLKGVSAKHMYQDTNVYEVKVMAYFDEGSGPQVDSLVSIIYVRDCSNAEIAWSSNCLNDNIEFSLVGNVGPLDSLIWETGDGNSYNVLNPLHTYSNVGEYIVKATGYFIEGGNPSSDSVMATINIVDCSGLTNISLTTSSQDISCFGLNDGFASSVASGGLTPYQYNWSNMLSTDSVVGLSPGQYFIEVTDAAGQQITDSVTINEPSLLTVSVTGSSNLTCFMSNDGSATALASGGIGEYTYMWSNGRAADTLVDAIATHYSVVALDSNGCQSAPDSLLITQPANLILSSSASNANCGQADGSVSVAVIGGASPYAFNWIDGSTESTLASITSGGYGVTVTDTSGCVAETFAMVGDNDGPTVSILSTINSNCGGNDGQVITEVSGGEEPYNYLWNNGVTAPHLLNAMAGEASVLVVDNNGCSGTAQTTITTQGNNPPSISGNVTTKLSGFSVNSGLVSILIPNPYGGQFIKVGETSLDINGFYAFDAIIPIGEYTLRVEADTTIPAYAYTIPTYYNLTNRWDSAEIINTVCDSAFVQNLIVIELPPLNGSNTLGGVVANDGSNKMFGQRAGDPIPGIDVALEQIPGGIIANTETDEDGRFEFGNVPVSDSSYTIYVDIPGLPMEESYEVDLSAVSDGSDSTITTLDFLVSDSTIYPTASPTAVKEFVKEEKKQLFVYPNPFTGYTNITYQVEATNNVSIEVYNLIGELVFQEIKGNASPGTYNVRFSGGDQINSTGVYFVKLAVGDIVQTSRIMQVK